MRRTIAVMIALSLPTAASAADWVFVANCGEPNQVRAYSYDAESVRRDRGNMVVRIRGDYSRLASSRAKEARIVWSFDCANRTFVERARTEYGAGREVVANYRQPTGAMSINRDSVAEKMFARICV